MLDQHKARDHVWHSFPLLVVRKTSEDLLLPCFSQEINPKLFTDSCYALVSREFTTNPERLSLTLTERIHILKYGKVLL